MPCNRNPYRIRDSHVRLLHAAAQVRMRPWLPPRAALRQSEGVHPITQPDGLALLPPRSRTG